MALAYQPLSGSPTVTNVLKNGIDITNTIMSQPINAYNYEADSRFKALYNYFKNNLVSTLGALLPIYQVLYSANANGTFNYQVIYNNVESCQLQYSPSLSNPYLILSYSAMGVAVPTTPSPSAQLGSDITRNALLSFLVQEKPSLFSSFLVVSISQISPGIFNIDLLTLYGTYFARVVNSGLLILTGVSMTSTNLCSDLASSEFTANPAVVTLNTYLQANYPSINGYSLSLVQGFMSGNNANYRLVYSQGTNRYEFLMSYSGNLGKYITSKATQYGGAGCDLSSVLIGSQCVRSCIAFSF